VCKTVERENENATDDREREKEEETKLHENKIELERNDIRFQCRYDDHEKLIALPK